MLRDLFTIIKLINMILMKCEYSYKAINGTKRCSHLRKFVPQTLVYICIYNLFHVPHTCLHFYKDYSSKIVYLKEVIAPKKSTMIENYINGH